MLKIFKNVKFNVATVLAVFGLFLICHPAFATSFDKSTYATGSKKLVDDITIALLVLIPITAALMIAYHSWKKSLADGDGAAINEANKAIKRILIAAVIGMTASALVKLITGYFITA